MSWLSKGVKGLGKGLKKVGKAVGKGWEAIDDYALPAIGFAVGGPGGAALGAAAARGIGDGKFNAKETLLAGAKGYAGGQLAGAAGLKGGQGLKVLGGSAKGALSNPIATGGNIVKSKLGMGGPNAAQVASDPTAGGMIGSWRPPTAGAAAASGAGGYRDTLKKIGGFAMDNLPVIAGGLAGVEGYKADKRAGKLRDKQLAMAEQNWNERAGLRTLGRDMMMNQQLEDLSGIYRNPSNPFA